MSKERISPILILPQDSVGLFYLIIIPSTVLCQQCHKKFMYTQRSSSNHYFLGEQGDKFKGQSFTSVTEDETGLKRYFRLVHNSATFVQLCLVCFPGSQDSAYSQSYFNDLPCLLLQCVLYGANFEKQLEATTGTEYGSASSNES